MLGDREMAGKGIARAALIIFSARQTDGPPRISIKNSSISDSQFHSRAFTANRIT
jgi:hypothetical protein